MTNFEKITASPEALAAFLEAIPAIEAPWDDAFHREYCKRCGLEDCDPCPHEEKRHQPAWWLAQEAEKNNSATNTDGERTEHNGRQNAQ